MRIDLNNDWKFSKTKDFNETEIVRLPHTNALLPFNYTDETEYQFISYYKKSFTYSSEWDGKKIFINFGGVAHSAKVSVNGKTIARHYSGYTSFTADITKAVNPAENEILVEVDSRESLNIPPFGGTIDYLTYGGIYREVWLETKDNFNIEDVFVRGFAEKNPYNFAADITLSKVSDRLSLKYTVTQNDVELLSGEENANGKNINIFGVADALLWSIDEPNLCVFTLQLFDKQNLVDAKEVVFGFRTCKFTPNGFLLNGKPQKIIGLNRHQSFPYVGYAMPERPQRRDARILKYELGLNAVRTSHYPQSQDFVDECDKIGLMVFTEIPGWQHIGDKKWQKQAIVNTTEMVTQYRNHPSIILWGVRINESQDCDQMYLETNRIARELDDSRQTGGVRYTRFSNLLEDVYTFNDFTHEGVNQGTAKRKDVVKGKVPFVVTEFNGHMFPTKSFDDEAHRTEHAIRHANVINSYLKDRKIAGGFGWCMADYNTHKDFGSGDKICYHGVMDMFRNRKMAAAVYSSNFKKENVLEISSTIDRGDYAKSNLGDVYAFTNADSVRLYRNDKFIKEFFPDVKKYRELPHPPVKIDDFLGNTIAEEQGFSRISSEAMKNMINYGRKHGASHIPLPYAVSMLLVSAREKITVKKLMELLMGYAEGWGTETVTYRFDAVSGGEVVKTVCKKPVSRVNLDFDVDSKILTEGATYDVASVRFRAVDFYGNTAPYFMEAVELSCTGCIEIIGPKIITLKGGLGGTYVRTTGEKGTGKLIVKGVGGEKEIKFTVN